MQTGTGLKVYQKVFLFWAIYVAFHFAYQLLPVALFTGTNESVFQHLKVGFFAYLLTSILEFSIHRRRILNRDSYFFSRLIVPAFYGRLPVIALEAVYGNIIVIIAGWFVSEFERGLEQIVYSKPLKAVILTLFLVSLCLYVIFTFKLPWADVFAEPK